MRILVHTLILAAVGIVFGMGASRALKGFLFGVTSTDRITFAGMVTVLTLVAAIAGYLPARRASRIDPMIALRSS
jgi:ABC-type antimicrobial peptide transport system permease subunit